MTSTDELESHQIHAQDCELEYWFQQAENYAEVQIPADDLRAIIARTYAAVNALPELLERVKRLEADLQVIAFGWRYVAEPDNSFTKVDWTRDQLIEYARAALNQETGQ